jgi:putative hydrolase of the HAD superfamily
MPTTAPVTRAILFDLGRVLLDIDLERALHVWAPHSRLPREALRAGFHADEPFQRHETGHLDNDGYFAHLRQALALDCDLAVVQQGFDAIIVGEIQETVRLLEQARTRVPCHAISNTNGSHLAAIERSFPGFLPRFTRVFASHQIGHRKPNAAAFQHVLREIGVPAPEVLLFDDLADNVAAARALGLQAVLVTRPEDVRAALAERGLLSPARAPSIPPRT